MSKFVVQADVVKRLSEVCQFFDSTTSHEVKNLVNTVMLENRSGHAYAVVTNEKIASIQYLGQTGNADGHCFLNLTEDFKKQLDFETMVSSVLTINTMPECAVSSIESTSGFSASDCCHWFDNSPLTSWRSWLCDEPVENNGFMYWDCFHVQTLLKTSPSGKISFPEKIDAEKPVVIRDKVDSSWAGVFLPQPNPSESVKPAVKPEWWDV